MLMPSLIAKKIRHQHENVNFVYLNYFYFLLWLLVVMALIPLKALVYQKEISQRVKRCFMQYKCQACHALKGYEDESLIKEFDTLVPLGGTSAIIKTYAQLVTSVINPSHKFAPRNKSIEEKLINDDGSSKMRLFNDVMTVQELIDLVAFFAT